MSPERVQIDEPGAVGAWQEERSGSLLTIGWHGRGWQFLCGQGREDSRQLNAKNRAAFLPVITENPAAVLLNDAETNAKPQPGSFADRLGCIERIENAGGFLKTGPRVREKDDDVGAIAHRLDSKDSALRGFHGVDGIANHIEEDLHQLVAISANARKNGFELKFDADGAGAH